jgi:hypothetical protein
MTEPPAHGNDVLSAAINSEAWSVASVATYEPEMQTYGKGPGGDKG